ncbi:ribonuclease P protein component [Pseudonocardia broussonetiae]|uniref:ribonuclease P protein component n=1 Tax=Pseudonocardia broussonetiae TaxID=2736640 RepID=UPI001963EF3B|nr:ribonuclease P protein component [Pseudonocardia broussonetiae]
MLPAASRLTRADEFASVIRRGRRSGRHRLVVHLQIVGDTGAPPRAGLVVSRAVGGAVVRHRVSRRLRHLLVPRLAPLPAGACVVVRALPPAAAATSAELGSDLDAALRGALRKLPAAPAQSGGAR